MLAATAPHTLDLAERLEAWATLVCEAGCSRLLGPATGLVKLVPPTGAWRALPAEDAQALVMAHVLTGAGDWRVSLAGNVVHRPAGRRAEAVHAQGGRFEPVDTLLQPPRFTLVELLALYAPAALPAWQPLLAGDGPRTLWLGEAPQLLPGRWLPQALGQLGLLEVPAPMAARDGLLYLPGR